MDETPVEILKSEQDWKQMCQDQTDLLNRANGQVRMLEGRIKLKDEAHATQVDGLRKEITDLTDRLNEVAASQGTVTAERYAKVVDDLMKAKDKTEATRKYAETQRKLAISFGNKYRELNGAVDKFASDVIAAMEPVLTILNAGNPVPEPTIVRTQCEAERQTTECGQAEPAA